MNSPKLLLVALAALAAVAHAASPKVPLKIEYPKYIHVGTPKPLTLANVDPPRQRAPEFLVAPTATLLSRGKPVTSSERSPVYGELSFVTDGDKTGIDGAVLELGPGTQWVQIDLGSSLPIDAIAVWHFHADSRAYHDVAVQISEDPEFRRSTTVFNNDDDNSSRLGTGRDRPYQESRFGRLIDARGISARYVWLLSNGSTSDEMNHYCEVEVFGRLPVMPPRRTAGADPFLTKKSGSPH